MFKLIYCFGVGDGEMIKIKVPASTANLGAGFDCFGMALNLYNEFEIDETNNGVTFLEAGKPSSIPLENNLIYNSMLKAFNKYNYNFKGLYINVSKADVPLSRGLGSSATCIGAGLAAANHLMHNIMTEQDLLNLATEIEGHPDNVVAAIKGGFNVSLWDSKNVTYSKIEPPEDLAFAALIPDFKMSTSDCRKVLPDNYSRKDCVFNVSHAALLICSLYQKDYSKFRECFKDKIHQPYRGTLIENMNEIFQKAEEFGSLGEFISGSGSTLMTVINKENTEFDKKMSLFLSSLAANWEVKILRPDFTGVQVSIL